MHKLKSIGCVKIATRELQRRINNSWQKTFLHKRRQDFIASILEGEGGSTYAYDAVRDAAYFEHLLELENEYDCNFSLSLSFIPKEEMEDVYVGYKTEKFTLPVLPLTVLVRVTVLVR
jgi:hypothetical protein